MELYDHIRRISFVFFVIVGLAHFISGLLYINGHFAPGSALVNRVLFIPFVLVTLTYAWSNLKYHLLSYGKDSKAVTYGTISLGIALFLALISIEFFVADAPCPLSFESCEI